MKIYRQISTIKAISFDLDDTLYDNVPIIKRAEAELITWLTQYFPHSTEATTVKFWRECKAHAIQQTPALSNDVTKCRFEALMLGFEQLGMKKAEERKELAKHAVDYFLSWRNKISISPEIELLLADLCKQMPLLVITNGNADISQHGIAKHFDKIYAANTQYPMKPAPNMHFNACKHLGIKPQHLLHVGDSIQSDILGARHANCASMWFNPTKQPVASKILPDIEVHDLQALRHFI